MATRYKIVGRLVDKNRVVGYQLVSGNGTLKNLDKQTVLSLARQNLIINAIYKRNSISGNGLDLRTLKSVNMSEADINRNMPSNHLRAKEYLLKQKLFGGVTFDLDFLDGNRVRLNKIISDTKSIDKLIIPSFITNFRHSRNIKEALFSGLDIKEVIIDNSKDTEISLYALFEFSSCRNLKVFIRNPEKVTDVSYMFLSNELLSSLTLVNFGVINATDATRMFYECTRLKNLDLRGMSTHELTTTKEMFAECIELEHIYFGNFGTSKVTSMDGMFKNCYHLKELYLKFNTTNVKDFSSMFSYCSNLVKLNIDTFNTSNALTMRSMFYGCNKLKEINLKKFNTSKVNDMSYMFHLCHSLESVDLSNFDLSSVKYMSGMFGMCKSLRRLEIRSRTPNLESLTGFLELCESLEVADLSGIDAHNLDFRRNFHIPFYDESESIITRCPKLRKLDLRNFDFRYYSGKMIGGSNTSLKLVDLRNLTIKNKDLINSILGLPTEPKIILRENNFKTDSGKQEIYNLLLTNTSKDKIIFI